MSFFENLEGLAGSARQLLANADGGDVAQAAADHAASLPPGELGDHLAQTVQGLGSGEAGNLAASLLSALGRHGQSADDVSAAGVDTDAAAAGDKSSVIDLIEHAKDHPEALQSAVMDYVKSNPQVVEQFAPPFLKGILGRLGG